MKLSIFIAFGIVGLCSSPVGAKATDAESVPQQFISSFNRGDVAAARATMSDSVAITDEVTPFHWQGKDAFGAWVSALTSDAKTKQLSDQKVILGQPSREILGPGHAYLVIPATYSFKQGGVAMTEVAQMTFAMDQTASGWKIAAWTWTGPDPSLSK